jgi:hypothetical protein
MAIPLGIAVEECRYLAVSSFRDCDTARYRHLEMAMPTGIAIKEYRYSPHGIAILEMATPLGIAI